MIACLHLQEGNRFVIVRSKFPGSPRKKRKNVPPQIMEVVISADSTVLYR